jgi:hypothetical protein
MRTSVVPLPSRALKISSERFVFSELYRITVPHLYSTLHTHPKSHRLWSVLPVHGFLSRPMAVSEGATIQHRVCRLRRIYFPRTRVYKGKKKMGRSTYADLALHNFNELSRPIIIVTPARPV